jgi:hypothetical protein
MGPQFAGKVGGITRLRHLNTVIGWNTSSVHRGFWVDAFSFNDIYWSSNEMRFIKVAWGVSIADFRYWHIMSLGH